MEIITILKNKSDIHKTLKSKVVTIYQCCGKENLISKGAALRTIRRSGRYWCTKCYANSDEGKAQRSNQSMKAWGDPNYRATNTEHNKRIANSEEGKIQRSIQSKNAWSNAEYRDFQVNRTTEMFTSSEHVEIVKSSNREHYQRDPEKYIQERVSVLYTPKARAKHKEALRKEEYREDHRKKALKRFESPEYKAKIAKGMANFPNAGKRSVPEQSLDNLLNRLSIPFTIEKEVGPYRFDTFIPSLNTYIEVHGEYWHGLDNNASRDAAKSAYLATTFPEAKLIVIYDYEFLSPGMVEARIRHELGLEAAKTVNFEFEDCEYKLTEIKDARIFFNSYHYAQFGKLPKFVLGAYLNGALIAAFKVAPVGRAESARKEGFNSKECYELDRFCIHPNYHKKNFASHFISKGLREFWQSFPLVKGLISFADETQGHSGVIYKASGWKELGKIKPDYHYINENGWKMHKKTLYNHARSAKLTERAWAEFHNWKKVFGRSKTKFIITSPNRLFRRD